MEEYTGQLIGGPDDGNLVTASVREIPITSSIDLWLDGNAEGKEKCTVVTKGVYIWDAQRGYFTWKLDRSEVATEQ